MPPETRATPACAGTRPAAAVHAGAPARGGRRLRACQSIAAEHGAGTLVYVGRFDLAEFAVVLEPDEPLRIARRAFYAGMAALADALIAHAQPETAITIDWPDSISVNHGLVGGGRLAWPNGTARTRRRPGWCSAP